MAIKVGNVIQAKVGTIAGNVDTASAPKTLFTLPANAMVIGVRAFGANDSGKVITIKSQPTNGASAAAAVATIDAGATAAGKNDAASMAGISYARQAFPVYITCYADSTDANKSWTVVVEYL